MFAHLALSLAVLGGAFCILAAFTVHFSRSRSPAASAAFGVLAAFSLCSAGIQLLLLFHVPGLFSAMAGGVVLGACWILFRSRSAAGAAWRRFGVFMRRHPAASVFLGLVFALLGLQAFLLPPGNHDSMTYNLARVMLMLQDAALHFERYTTLRQVVFPYGFDLLHFPFLLYGSDFGLGLPSFLCFIGTFCATYALSKGRGEAVALLTAAFVASLPELVLQATSTKNDLACAFSAVAAILAARDFRKRKDIESACLYVLATAFGLVSKNYFALFAAPFSLLLLVDFLRRGGFRNVQTHFSRGAQVTAALALTLLCLWGEHLVSNTMKFGGPFGPEDYVTIFRNKDEERGASANALRYLVQASGAAALDKKKAVAFHDAVLGENRSAGALFDFGETVNDSFMPHEDLEWFGFVGAALILSALGCCLVGRNHVFQRMTALATAAYVAAVCIFIAWMPWNGRFFALAAAASGGCLAVLFSRFGPWPRRALWAFLAASVAFTVLYNKQKPILDPDFLELLGEVRISEHVLEPLADRDYYYDRWAGAQGFTARFAKRIPEGAKVLVWSGDGSWVFPFLFRGAGARFTMAGPTDNPKISGGKASAEARKDAPPEAGDRAFDFLLVLSPSHHQTQMRDFEKDWTVLESAPSALLLRPGPSERPRFDSDSPRGTAVDSAK